MKLHALVIALTASLISVSAYAQYIGPSYSGSTNTVSTVQNRMLKSVSQLTNLSNRTRVAVEGTISRQTGSTTYEFTDETGTVPVTIKTTVKWPGNVSDNDLVRLVGRIERKNSVNTISVDTIERITRKTPIPR